MSNELMLAICGAVVVLLLVLRNWIFAGTTKSQGYKVWIIDAGHGGFGNPAEDLGDWPTEIDVPDDFFNRTESISQKERPAGRGNLKL